MSRVSSKLLKSLQISPDKRSKEDIDRIAAYLSQITDLLYCDTEKLILCAQIVNFSIFCKNDFIFKRSEFIAKWYYMIYGSVIIGAEMFVPHKSFGTRDNESTKRQGDCIVLEETAVLIFPYSIGCSHDNYPCICLDHRKSESHIDSQQFTNKMNRKSQQGSDTSSSGYSGSDKISTGDGDSESVNWPLGHEMPGTNNVLRQSTGSSSQKTTDPIGIDSESDDEDFSDLTFNEVSCQDNIKEILLKDPKDRTGHEFDSLMNIIQNIPIFSLWPQSLQRAACKLARLKIVDKANTVLIKKGEALTDWHYCLQGTLEMRRSPPCEVDMGSIGTVGSEHTQTGGDYTHSSIPTSTSSTNSSSGIHNRSNNNLGDVLETLRYSDNFGADLRLSDVQISHFYLVSACDDCWLMLISQKDFIAAKSKEPTNLSQVIEQNKTVVVMEHRTAPDGVTQGDVLVKATSKKLIDYLFETHSAAELCFVENFFLTYNVHMDSSLTVRNSIIDNLQSKSPLRRNKCSDIVVRWINNHFHELERQIEILKFIDFVVLILLREGEKDLARNIYLACSRNALQRTITLVCNDRDKSSRPVFVGNGTRMPAKEMYSYCHKEDYPPEFARLLPNLLTKDISSVRMHGLFVKFQQSAAAGHSTTDSSTIIRPGDRLLYLNSTPEEYLSQQQTNNIISKSQLCTFIVKFDPAGYFGPFFNSKEHEPISKSNVTIKTPIERSSSIHNSLCDMMNQSEHNISDIGYSTLPLRPANSGVKPSGDTVSLSRGNNNSKKQHHQISNSTNSAVNTNQSTLKKMMKRCKANNNSFATGEDPGGSMGLGGLMQTKKMSGNTQQMSKCRSAHTSPNRSGNVGSNKSQVGEDEGCGGSSRSGSTQYLAGLRVASASGDRNGAGAGIAAMFQPQHLLMLNQPVRMRKIPRNRCGSQPDLRQLIPATSNPELSTVKYKLSCSSSESVIKIHYRETASDSSLNILNGSGLSNGSSSTLTGLTGSSISSSTTILKSNCATRFCYMLITPETETIEVILKCINDLNLPCSSSDDFVLVEVTVEPGTMLKQKIIKHNVSNLASIVKLNNRLYLKRRDFSGQLLDNSDIEEIESEMNRSFINLSLCELAVQIFSEAFMTFKSISSSEILDFVTQKSRIEPQNNGDKIPSKSPAKLCDDKTNRFHEYMRLGEKYMYFVVNVICSEYSSCSKRVKILKKLINLARLCKELGNIEIFFSLMNGLDRVEVTRLHQTWDKLSTKHQKMYRQMQQLLDVSGNMRLLRSLHRTIQNSSHQPTAGSSVTQLRVSSSHQSDSHTVHFGSTNVVIPMAALITKDLTTVHEVHPTRVPPDSGESISPAHTSSNQNNQLINFDKLRIMCGLIRRFKNCIYTCANPEYEIYHKDQCHNIPEDEQSQFQFLRNCINCIENKDGSRNVSSFNKRLSMNINLKKLYEREFERLRVKHFLQKFNRIEKDDAHLLTLSYKCEVRNDHSSLTPSINRTLFNTSLTNSMHDRVSLSSKESSQHSNDYCNDHSSSLSFTQIRQGSSSTLSSSQVQYLEPSNSISSGTSNRRYVAPPPPYGQSVNPPIPPRRRSSTTAMTNVSSNNSSHHSDNKTNKHLNTATSLTKAFYVRYQSN